MIVLHTRKSRSIENGWNEGIVTPLETKIMNDLEKEFYTALPRTSPSKRYNCHGLVFASKRTNVWESKDVRTIISDDDYVKLSTIDEVMPGDYVAYIDETGDVEHSGIVLSIEYLDPIRKRGPIPKILSKWGSGKEFVHALKECPYPNTTNEFYRLWI
jgi:hypothetical protein